MKLFRQFIIEMATVSAIYPKGSRSKKYDWDKFDKNGELTRLLLRDIGSLHYKLYRTGNSSFYLTDKDDEYLGQLEGTTSNGALSISNSSTNLEKGFYNIMFTSILGTEAFSEIRSDNDLSINAINSYGRLSINGRLLIQVYNPDTKEYLPFSKDNLLAKSSNIVSVKEKEIGTIHEHFIEYYKRIHRIDMGSPSILNKEFNTNNPFVDNYLFCENFIDDIRVNNLIKEGLYDYV
jgi:hypothetical protein